MKAIAKTVYVSDNGVEYDTVEEALYADKAHKNLVALESLDIDWRDCGSSSLSEALVDAGYTIKPLNPA